MSNRVGFDFVQESIGESLNKFANYFSTDPIIGINNDWFTLYTSVFGSIDYFHLVSCPLSGMYSYQHPMYLDGVSDGNTFGYVNADLTNEGKESHLVVSGIFDVDWAPCSNGSGTYPAWDGYPVVNHSLSSYPMDGTTRMFVLLKGMMVRIDSSINTTYDETFYFDATRMLNESLRPSDYYDIRVFRYDDAVNDPSMGWVPDGIIYELPRIFSGTDLVIQIGRTAGEDIPDNEPRFFMIYWESPDTYCATSVPVSTVVNDITSFLTFNQGNTPLSRELFNTNRYDFIDFSNSGNKYLKNYYTTRYEMVDGNPNHYDDPNPIFYILPSMNGSLDPLSTPVWNYGYSLDQGTNDPAEWILQGVIVCYQAAAGEDTEMEVIVGPIVPPEFQPDLIENFEWYPEVPDEYTLFAKAVVKIIKSEHQVAYRPETIVEYLEYIKNYGREKVENETYFSFLSQILLENAFLNNYLETILSPILIPIIYMTPVTSSRIGGMNYNSLYILNTESVFNIFNTYWKIPVQHPLVPPPAITPVDNVHDYIKQQVNNEYTQLEFNEDIRSTLSQNGQQQLSTILGSFYSDDNNQYFGTKCYNDKKVYIPTNLELHNPITNSCYDYSELPQLKYDYSFRFKLRSQSYDFITKDLFVSASKYYISDTQSTNLVANGLNPQQFLWSAKLNTIHDWIMYGRTMLIPDLTGGENATIEMKQFKPRDPSLPLYDDFVAALQLQYYDDLHSGDPIRIQNANDAIDLAISQQEAQYGGFDDPDTRTIANLIYSMDEFITVVSLYNTTGIPYWTTTVDFWGGDPAYYDIFTGTVIDRYGFTINGYWYYQNFTQALVSIQRQLYVDDHPVSSYILQEQDDDTGTPNNTFALDDTKFALSTTFTADFADVYNQVFQVRLKLKLENVPTANLILTINGTNISKIPTNILQTSDPVQYTSLSGDFEWIVFNFSRPATLESTNRYALVLTSQDPLSGYNGVDSLNTIEWAFASSDIHSYGVTDTNSLLTVAAKTGDVSLTVADGSIYSSAPFYIKIGPETFEVTSVVGNYLNIFGSLAHDYDISTPVYEVVYVPADSEVRWVYVKNGEIYDWTPVATNPSYDATYQLYRKIDDVGLVTIVPFQEWNGIDLAVAKTRADGFYIASSADSYRIPTAEEALRQPFYGEMPGLSPFAGFNVPNSYDFPPVNTWRAGYTNLVDGVISWSSKEVETPVQFSVFPLAYNNSGFVAYLPTQHDMYITAICKKPQNIKKVVNLLVPAGTSSPILLDSDYFIGIDLIWVDSQEFKSEPFYGYGAAESFVIRSI